MTTYPPQTYIFTALAVLAGIFAVSGIEDKFFSVRADPEKITKKALSKIEPAESLVKQSQIQTAFSESEDSFVLTQKGAVPDQQEQSQDDYLLFSGTITLSDNSKRGIINGTSVAVGSSYRGYTITEITNDQISVEKEGQQITIDLYEKYSVESSKSVELNLTRIIQENGKWKAVFKNKAYDVGDWLDSATRIQAITPKRVLISRDGKNQTLTVP